MAVRSLPAKGSRALEVLGDDVIGVQRGGEALDLVLHVGVRQALEVPDQRRGAAVELLVEALDELLVEDAGAGPLAVGAAQRDLPRGRAGLLPLGRVAQAGGARATDVEVAGRVVVRVDGRRGDRTGRRGADALVLEVDDLDRLPGGKDDAADVVAGVVEAHRLSNRLV